MNKKNFENHIGQTVQIGDPVVVVASGYGHDVNVYSGTFIGWSESGRKQCRVKCKWTSGYRIGTYPAGRIYKIDPKGVDK